MPSFYSDPEYWRAVQTKLPESARGIGSALLGTPVDIANLPLMLGQYLTGTPVSEPIGGSEALRKAFGGGEDITDTELFSSVFGGLLDPATIAAAAPKIAAAVSTAAPLGMMGLLGGDIAQAMRRLGPGADQGGMVAYHGTPHRLPPHPDNPLGKFDNSKIGTGEGAQAYGHGMYFAENPKVAGEYAANVKLSSPPKEFVASNGATYQRGTTAADWYVRGGNGKSYPVDPAVATKAWAETNQGGNLYNVDIPDEHIAKMLDWDAPLSEQTESVKKAIAAMDKSKFDAHTRKILDQQGDEINGGSLYELLGADDNIGSREAASKILNSIDIPGIKYYDGGSRSAGKGTRNFVVFDDNLPKILKRE